MSRLELEETHKGLWRLSNLEIRAWATLLYEEHTATPVNQIYKEQEWDLDGDLGRAASSFAKAVKEDGMPHRQASYELKLAWRFLLRRYSLCGALAVDRALVELGEKWWWRIWRWKDWFLLRLGMGVGVGFGALSSGGILINALQKAPGKGYFPWILSSCLLLVFGLAIAEVQRRAGRLSMLRIVGRATRVTVTGGIYALLGGLVQYHVGRDLEFDVNGRSVILTAAMATVFGFLLQLFWQDRSIGDPL